MKPKRLACRILLKFRRLYKLLLKSFLRNSVMKPRSPVVRSMKLSINIGYLLVIKQLCLIYKFFILVSINQMNI